MGADDTAQEELAGRPAVWILLGREELLFNGG